jgi:phosphohistidine phosphatase SixA
MTNRQFLWLFACLPRLFGYSTAATADAESDLLDRLAAGGYVMLLQHVSALPSAEPKSILPPLHCSGNDTLSENGQIEAQRLRKELKGNGVSIGRVLSSHDCRCVQTAGIAFGIAEPWSIADEAGNADSPANAAKSAALYEAISRWSSNENLVIVSHQSNFQQAINTHPEGNQLLIIQPLGDDGFRLLGRLNVD